ncbi:hypothetical protein TgHK011_006824 [Trichoderma gracile]|nr:hypothetical protein TgHK011_006824 [Trichoderma gracile]
MMPQPERQTNQRARQATTAASLPSPALMHSASAGPSGRLAVGILRAGGTTSPRRQPLAATRSPEATAGGARSSLGPILPAPKAVLGPSS